MEVGKRITELRNKKGITVNKLANISGVSQSFLRDIELGKKQPTVEYLEYICFGLGVSLKDFFDTDKPDDSLLSLICSLTESQRKTLLAFITEMKK